MKSLIAIIVCASGMLLYSATNATQTVVAPATNSVPLKVEKPLRSRCEATTLSGNRCKRRAAVDSKYCSQHAAIMRKRKILKK